MTIDATCKTRFMRNNLLELSFNALSVSSENSSYPKTNLYDKVRSNPFYFNQRFEITASTNQLYFNDGLAKTATITAGEYTGTTLATEIQTQLNTISSGFTVTHLTDSIFRFVNGSSFTLSLTSTTNAIWDTLGFTGVVDETGTTIDADRARYHYPYEYILVDFGYNARVDFIGMVSSLEADFTIPDEATVTVEANNINDFTAPPYTATPTYNSLGLFHFITDVDSDYRYWRIKIEAKEWDPPSASLYSLGAGYLHMGAFESLSTDNRNVSVGFNHLSNDLSDSNMSDTGKKFFNRRVKRAQFGGLLLPLLGTTDKEVLERIYDDVGMNTPFFISLDPTVTVTDDISKLTKLVYFEGPPTFTHVNYNRFNAAFSLVEVV